MSRTMMRRMAFCLLAFFSFSMAANVTVDLSTTFQTIDGMGGFGSMRPWWSGGPFFNSQWLSTVIDDLGFSMIRTEFYPRPDQADAWTRQIPYLKAIKEKADASGETLRVIATVWTPPSAMKTTGHPNTGELIREKASEYADYLITYIKDFKTSCGYDLYAISPGNEVQVVHGWFNGCKWDPSFLGDFCIMLAQKIIQEGLPTRIFYGDDLYNHFYYAKQVDDRILTQQDAVKNVVRAAAMHYGADGTSVNVFRSYGALTTARSRVAWNTEFGNGANTWGDAWGKAKDIMMMLQHNYGAIVYWLIGPHTNSGQLEESVMPDDRPGPKAYTAKSYFRFIRPGAIRVGAASDDDNLWTVAFKQPESGRITVIMLNNGSSTITATVQGTGLAEPFDMYRTGEGSNCVKTGTVTAGSSIQVPARNIVSLYSPETTGALTPRSARAAALLRNPVSRTLIGLDGRAVRLSGARTQGVFFSVSSYKEGPRSVQRIFRNDR